MVTYSLMVAIWAAGVLFDLLSFPATAAAGAVQEIQLPQTLLDKVSLLNSSQPVTRLLT